MDDQSQTNNSAGVFVEVAKIGRAHGVKGEVRVFTQNPAWEMFQPGETLYIEQEFGERRPVTIEKWRQADKFVIAKFEEIDDRNEAETLRNCMITVPEEEMPDPGGEEIYHHDIEGRKVYLRPADDENESESTYIGDVRGVFETGANDVMVVDLDESDDELYVPMFEGAVEPIEPKDKDVYVRPLAEWAPDDTEI